VVCHKNGGPKYGNQLQRFNKSRLTGHNSKLVNRDSFYKISHRFPSLIKLRHCKNDLLAVFLTDPVRLVPKGVVLHDLPVNHCRQLKQGGAARIQANCLIPDFCVNFITSGHFQSTSDFLISSRRTSYFRWCPRFWLCLMLAQNDFLLAKPRAFAQSAGRPLHSSRPVFLSQTVYHA
jgi:hypothetical protein